PCRPQCGRARRPTGRGSRSRPRRRDTAGRRGATPATIAAREHAPAPAGVPKRGQRAAKAGQRHPPEELSLIDRDEDHMSWELDHVFLTVPDLVRSERLLTEFGM